VPDHGQWADAEFTPVSAVSSPDPVRGEEANTYRSSCARKLDGSYVIGGAPIVGAEGNDLYGWTADGQLTGEQQVWTLDAPLIPRLDWQVEPPGGDPDFSLLDDFLSGPSFQSPLPEWQTGDPPSVRARELMRREQWDVRIQDLVRRPDPASLGGFQAGGSSGETPGEASLDLGACLAVAGTDPASGAWLGHFRVVRRDDGASVLLRSVLLLAAYAVPRDLTETDPAFLVAHQYALDHPQTQSEGSALLRRLYPEYDDCLALLQDTHEVVVVATGAVVAGLPDPPEPPRVAPWVPGPADSTLATGIQISGHQGSPVAVQREYHGRAERDYLVLPQTGVVVDEGWSGPPGQIPYTVHVQDPWGQWSEAGTCQVDKRPPKLAAPRVTLEFRPDRDVPGAAPASPGHVHVRALVTDPPLGGAPVTGVTAYLDGAQAESMAMTRTDGQVWTVLATVRATVPGEKLDVVATRVVAHTASGDLPPGSATVRAADNRPVVFPMSSRVLILSEPRRHDGSAETDLLVAAPSSPPDGTSYRVYAADESAVLGHPVQPQRSRCRRVQELLQSPQLRERRHYVRLADGAATVVPGGVRIRVPLPGRSNALRALLLAPVTAGGVETPPEQCGVVVVGVPLDDRPPPPTVTVERAPWSREVTVRVVVNVPRSVVMDLERRELSGESATLRAELLWAPDEYGSVARAVRAGEVLDLVPDGTISSTVYRWSGERTLAVPDGVPQYTALRLWARVAWPAEPTHVPGTTPELGNVRPFRAPTRPLTEWSDPSPGVRVLPTEPAPIVSCTAAAHEIRMSWPRIAAADPPWQVVVSSSTGDLLTRTGREATLIVPLPDPSTPWTAPRKDWRVVVTCPDGTAGPVFNGLGERL